MVVRATEDTMIESMLAGNAMAKGRKDVPVRIDEEALKVAKIAASFKGITLKDYVSAALIEIAKRDIDQGYASMAGKRSEKTPRPGDDR